jgi:hypothetical protein
MKRQLSTAIGVLLLLAAAASVALIGGSGPSQAAGSPSSAYGIAATGAFPFAPTPAVVSDDGALVTDSAGSPPDNPLLAGGVLEVSARNGAASASLARLTVGDGILDQLPEDLGAQLAPVCDGLEQVPLERVTDPVTGELLEGALEDLVNQIDENAEPLDLSGITALDLSQLLPSELSGLCDVLSGEAGLLGAGVVRASCTGSSGATTIADLKALGLPLEVDTEAVGDSVTVPGVLSVTVNRQTANADGTFTVDALVLDLVDQEEVVIASATCGRVTTASDPAPDPDEPPSPTPVEVDLPVTG